MAWASVGSLGNTDISYTGNKTYSNAILLGAYLVFMLLKFSSSPVCLQ